MKAFEDWYAAQFEAIKTSSDFTLSRMRLAFEAGQSSAISAAAKVAEDQVKSIEAETAPSTYVGERMRVAALACAKSITKSIRALTQRQDED